MLKKLFLALIISAVAVGCSQTSEEDAGTIFTDTPITRGQAVKMLALSKYSLDEINNMTRELELTDSSVSNWCDKYINAASKAGLMSGTEEKTFLQDNMLTLEQASFILDRADNGKNLVLQYDAADRKKPISSNVWYQAFDSIKNNVEEKNIVIFADNSLCDSLRNGYVLSSEGLLNSEGINIDKGCFNRSIKVYLKDNCILGIKELNSDEPTINGAVVEEKTEGLAKLNIRGCHIYFENNFPLEVGQSVNIKINGSKITELV